MCINYEKKRKKNILNTIFTSKNTTHYKIALVILMYDYYFLQIIISKFKFYIVVGVTVTKI